MFRFCRFLCGSRVIVSFQVISGAVFFGQQVIMGMRLRSTLSLETIFCWQGVLRSRFVGMFNICLNCGSLLNRSRKFFGGFGFFRNVNNLLILRSVEIFFCFMFIVTRFGVSNRLYSIGIEQFLGFSNNSVGLSVRKVRLVILVIFRCGFIGSVIRFSLFCCLSSVKKSRKSLYFMAFIVVF